LASNATYLKALSTCIPQGNRVWNWLIVFMRWID